MIVRFSWRKLFLAALCVVPIGCEPHRSFTRDKDEEDPMVRAANAKDGDNSSSSKVIGASSDNEDASTFFKDSRRYGGLSSEANSIERDLGVGN